MASLNKLKSVPLIEFERLLEQARTEHWQQITLLGADVRLEPPEAWRLPLEAADEIFRQATVEGLAGKLQTLSDLTVLNLSGNNIGDEGAKAIAASLPGLTSLNLGGNNIGAEGAKAIAAQLPALTSLNLNENNIGAEGAKAIAAALPDLTSLDLGSNNIDDEGAKAIAASLSGLTSLDLGDNKIGAEGAKAIAAALPGLTSLNLGGGHNDIGNEGAKAIAAALHGLTSLDLRYNHIDDEGAKAIATALPRLTSLILSGNDIGDEGVKAIAAALPGLTSLQLWGNKIGDEGAKAIAAALPNLTSLNLGNNNVGLEGAKAIAAALAGLTSLWLWNNNIGDEAAKAIAAALPGLTSLNLRDNNIGDEGAKAIATSLPGLSSLDLRHNNVGDEGANAIAASLRRLILLDLSSNNIGAEGAKAIAASLSGLSSLDLSSNNIGAEGVKALLNAWSLERKGGQLRYLSLRDSGDLGGLLPKEVFESSDAQSILAAYRGFVIAQQKQALRPLNELKLLVVGSEAVGKTSLLQYLITGKPRDPREPKTPGIVQHERIQIQGWSPHDCQVQLNVWDFGGQEMMRGTHRFFLTERSLYLLVLEDRRQDDRSIYDWIKTIHNRGGVSPVIVVINKSDEGKQDLRLDENTLRTTYANIVAFLRTSCDPGDWASASIERLRLKIVDIITKHENLKHVRDPIPASWLRIKGRVRELADQRAVLPHADFIALCKEDPGDGTEPIVEENEQRALLRVLHELGAIVAHGLERDAPAARREINLLDPNWLTGAVYRILDKARSVDQEGEFVRRQLVDWLDPGSYPPERYEFILDMMQDRDIGLCFRLPTLREERYLIPEALPANSRFFGKWPEDSLRFRYVYNYLPPGLIPRFIVQSHGNLTQKSRWRTGAVLEVSGCEVLVLADPDRRHVDIQVTGPPTLRRAALNIVLNHLEVVHQLHREAEAVAFVPLPDHPEVHVSYEHLLKLERLQGAIFPYFPDGADRSYAIGELLDGVRRDDQKQAGASQSLTTKPHVVIFVHGIRTRALWQNELRKSLEQDGFKVQPTNYGYFDVIRFLFPGQIFSGKVINKVTRQIRHAININKEAKYSIIAHSFGTFICTNILREHTDLEFNKIVFCGSVVPYNFRFEDYRRNFQEPVINEVGTRDFWPVIAEVVTFGYGSTGTYGIRTPAVRDRWHNGKAHSDFLNEEFCRKYWVPLLRNGEIIDDEAEAERPPWWLWAVSTFQIRFAVPLAAIAFFCRGWLTAAWSALGTR